MANLDMTTKASGRERTRIYTERLNFLFRFAELDPWKLNNGAWETFLDDLHFAMYGAARKREGSKVIWSFGNFSQTATRDGVSKAQRSLSRFIDKGWAELIKAKVLLSAFTEETEFAGEYYYRFESEDFATLVNLEFAHLMSVCEIKQSDFLACAQCGITFVPRRKPREGTPNYCSTKCANIVAAKTYREKRKAVKKGGVKEKRKRREE
jgi:hypothetical protein